MSAPDDADLRAENERLRAEIAERQAWHPHSAVLPTRLAEARAARDAALAGERAAREEAERVRQDYGQTLVAGYLASASALYVAGYREAGEWLEQHAKDLRADLSLTPPDTAGDDLDPRPCNGRDPRVCARLGCVNEGTDPGWNPVPPGAGQDAEGSRSRGGRRPRSAFTGQFLTAEQET